MVYSMFMLVCCYITCVRSQCCGPGAVVQGRHQIRSHLAHVGHPVVAWAEVMKSSHVVLKGSCVPTCRAWNDESCF